MIRSDLQSSCEGSGGADDAHHGLDEDEAMEAVRRDKGKGEKYASMVRAGALPEHIQHLYEHVAQNKSSPRSFRTLIVNTLFEKLLSGRYELRDKHPMFIEAKEIYEKKYAKDTSIAVPKLIMKGMYFNGSSLNCLTSL